MQVVLVNLDPVGPSAYIIVGLALIFGSRVVRRLSIGLISHIAEPDKSDCVEVRLRSKNVVSINRRNHLSQQGVIPARRVCNYS
jgi:hypothetical protein